MQTALMENSNYKTYVSSRILANSVALENGCMQYGKHDIKHAYGLVSITWKKKRKAVPAARALWMAVNDRFDLPQEMQVRHSCGNPRCVEITHLECREPYAPSKKVKKMFTRVRRFNDEEIRDIRSACGTYVQIALEFNTTIGYVSKIKSGKAKALVK